MDSDPDLIVQFGKRKRIRFRLEAGGAVVIVIAVLIQVYGPSGEPFGLALGLWGVVMIAVAFGVYWRCPKCGEFLGRNFKDSCPRCGTRLRKEDGIE